jgi:hypothetical protein
VREERTGLGEDCNSSSDSINISVPLFVHRSDDRLLSYTSTWCRFYESPFFGRKAFGQVFLFLNNG